MGPSLPNLLATVAGNLSELKQFSGLKLLDITLPPIFLTKYQGPQFGIAGTRAFTGVYDRPIIGTIIKPSVGMSPETTAAQVKTLVEAGIDFIKDDELQSDGPHCPFDRRVTAVMNVINRHADNTGKRVMYAANITGDLDEMLRRHDTVVEHDGTCVMVSMNSIGLPAMKALRPHCQVVIHGHRNGWGMLGRSPAIGMCFIAFQKFWRLAGIDHTHVNGLSNKFCEPDDSVIASARACLTPMFEPPNPGCEIMPVFSSGQSARQAPDTYKALGTSRPHLRRRWRHHGSSTRPNRRRAQPATGLASRSPQHSFTRIRHHPPRAQGCAGDVRSMSSLLYIYYGDDFTGSTDVLESLALAGIESVLFLGLPSQNTSRSIPQLPSHRNRRRQSQPTPRVDVSKSSSNIRETKSVQSPSHPLQNLLHLRQLTHPRQHRSRNGDRPRNLSARVRPNRRRRAASRPLRRLWKPIRNRRRQGLPHRRTSHDALPSRNPHDRSRPPQTSCRANGDANRTDRHSSVEQQRNRGSNHREIKRERKQSSSTASMTTSLTITGKLLWQEATHRPLFAVGSSGLTEALITQWQFAGIATPSPKDQAKPVDQIFVLSGSCSPVTEGQIRWARANGFTAISHRSLEPHKSSNHRRHSRGRRQECIEVAR